MNWNKNISDILAATWLLITLEPIKSHSNYLYQFFYYMSDKGAIDLSPSTHNIFIGIGFST